MVAAVIVVVAVVVVVGRVGAIGEVSVVGVVDVVGVVGVVRVPGSELLVLLSLGDGIIRGTLVVDSGLLGLPGDESVAEGDPADGESKLELCICIDVFCAVVKEVE